MKPTATIAMIGALDHGKTTLTIAIAHALAKPSDFDHIDRMPSERAHVTPTHYEYESEARRYVHFDAPSHLQALDELNRPDRPFDGAVLVVSARDGVVDQTREVLRIVRGWGLESFVVALTHLDRVEDLELVDVVELEIRELMSAQGLAGDDVPLVRMHGVPFAPDHKASVMELVRACDAHLPHRIE